MSRGKVEVHPSIATVVEWLQLCGDFRSFQTFVRERGLPSGVGWEQIAEGLSKRPLDRVMEALDEHVDEIVRYGTKSVFLVDVPQIVRRGLRAYAAAHEERAEGWDLSSGGEKGIVVREAARAKTPATFVSRSMRRLTKREAIDKEWLKVDRLKELGRDVELFAIATRSIPVFDIVRVPASGPITVHITSSFNGYRMPLKAERIADELALALSTDTEIDFSPRYRDLFSLVDAIYDDRKEGRIAGIRFNCGTGAKRHEEHPSKDLRSELYHVAGVQKTTIELYALTVAWVNGTDDVAMSLNGTARMLDMLPGSRLFRAESTAWSERDHNFVIAKLVALAAKHVQDEDDADDDEADR